MFLCFTNVKAQKKTLTESAGIEKPKIIIGLVVDQMRWDYLYRFYNRYSNGGFKRLLQKGFNFNNTLIPYAPAVTAVGHASIYTGSVGAINGMVGNSWMERADGSYMYCVQDKLVTGVGADGLSAKMSPRNLLSTTIGDELRLATNFKSRVFGISLKDRGGIIPAGRSGNAAYWFDDNSGSWITSSWYMPQLPSWVNTFNSSRKIDSFMLRDWDLLYERSSYVQSVADNNTFEKSMIYDTSRSFPHTYKKMIGKNYADFRYSPYGNTYTLDFSTRLIEMEKLGTGTQTDMLCISLSSTDYIGHIFGPNSMEVEDTYLRLDKDLQQFLIFLDKKFGAGNYLFFLSADHGAPPVPDFMKENKMSAGHLNGYYGLMDSLNKLTLEKFGVRKIVKRVLEYQVYLDNKIIDSSKLNIREIKNVIVKYLKDHRDVVNAFDYENFHNVIMPVEIKEMFAKGYFYNRSGDIQFQLKPNYTDVTSKGTEHGTVYKYDTHIPLIWYGWKIKPGKTSREVYMTDIAPTIAAMLNIQMPNGSIGKVLPEIVN